MAQARARTAGGVLVLRIDDLDRDRCKPGFVAAMYEDLRWCGFNWEEGPDLGGPHAPYAQSDRTALYRSALEKLRAGGFVYPCTCSRQDVLRAAAAPHAGEDEPVYPGTCRPAGAGAGAVSAPPVKTGSAAPPNWRFRVPDGERVGFTDGACGAQEFWAGRDFGDFVVWRHDDVPAYQLASVVDDAAMRVTEVVRGADLLRSTARQLLLFRALGLAAPEFFHCPLVTDAQGVRLAKRHDALSLRRLREQGEDPQHLRAAWAPAGNPP